MPYVQRGDVRLHYERYGSGSPVLLIAGTAYAGDTWLATTVEALAARHTVITYDHRGIGQSSPGSALAYSTAMLAEDAREVLRAVTESPAHVITHSMGGMIAQELYFLDPGAVRSLVFGASGAGGSEPRTDAAVVPVETVLGLMDMGIPAYAAAKHRSLFYTASYQRQHAAEVEWLDATFARGCPDVGVYLRHLAARSAHGAASRLPDIQAPALVVVGSEDKHGFGKTRVEMAEELARQIPAAQFHVIAGAKHGIIWEDEEEFLLVTTRFLDAVEGQANGVTDPEAIASGPQGLQAGVRG